MFESDQFIANSRSCSSSTVPIYYPPLYDPYSSSLINHHHHHQESMESSSSWSHDEVLALLKVRSSMEIWFPEFTWEHISRKLGEVGFKKSPQECKERFEELESTNFTNNVSSNYKHLMKNNANIFSEFDQNIENKKPCHDEEEVVKKPQKTSIIKKIMRKRSKAKFEMFKGFCEAFVNKMMAQQEEMHNKMIEDIMKRDEEKFAREEAWKNQEMDRLRKAVELRAKEQQNAAEKYGKIIDFLKKFTSQEDGHGLVVNHKTITSNNSSTSDHCNNNNNNNINSNAAPRVPLPSTVEEDDEEEEENPSPSHEMTKIPTSPTTSNLDQMTKIPPSPSISSRTHLDIGKRWPRDEVLALINLRCKMMSGNNSHNSHHHDHDDHHHHHHHEEVKDVIKGPLWERISQGMMELGFNRSAKRCKEKWENINKYFRKTKDSNKKRSVDSRTCPYFHHLTTLYTTQNASSSSSSLPN